MAHNTMYKHLAKHIRMQRDTTFGETEQRIRDAAMDDLCWDFAGEVAERQPGSFDKIRFLYESGTTDAEGRRIREVV